MISVENLNFAYDEKPIISDLSCNFEKRERVCISGPSGKGKTTLLRIICGLEKKFKGSVKVPKGTRFSVTFQDDVLLPWMTTKENVACVSDDRTAIKWLSLFELGDSLEKYPDELSKGMCRRVALARAAAYDGDILVLDEGFSGLDDKIKEKIMEALKNEFSEKIIIFTSHDTREIESFSTKIINL